MAPLSLTLFGTPGAGKGTQAARLHDDLHLAYIATGDLLRAHRSRQTELGRAAFRVHAGGTAGAGRTRHLHDHRGTARRYRPGIPAGRVPPAPSRRRTRSTTHCAREIANSPPRSSCTCRTTW